MIQFDVLTGRVEENLAIIFAYLEKMAEQGVQLAVLPEMFTCSFDNENLSRHAQTTHDVITRLSGFAKDKRMALAGSLPVADSAGIYNTMVVIDTDGSVAGDYQKIHLFKLTRENDYYTPGNRIDTVQTGLGPVGLMICYDIRFPELSRALYLKGARILLVSAQWPTPRVHHWQSLLKARAIENQLFVIASNRTGTDASLEFPGSSVIVDPFGDILADAGKEAGHATADIDLNRVETARNMIPCRKDRRSDIYG